MRIVVETLDGSKIIAEPTLLDVRQAGPELQQALAEGEVDPIGSQIAAAELAHIALVNAGATDVPKSLDKFLRQISFDAEALSIEGTDADPTGDE